MHPSRSTLWLKKITHQLLYQNKLSTKINRGKKTECEKGFLCKLDSMPQHFLSFKSFGKGKQSTSQMSFSLTRTQKKPSQIPQEVQHPQRSKQNVTVSGAHSSKESQPLLWQSPEEVMTIVWKARLVSVNRRCLCWDEGSEEGDQHAKKNGGGGGHVRWGRGLLGWLRGGVLRCLLLSCRLKTTAES